MPSRSAFTQGQVVLILAIIGGLLVLSPSIAGWVKRLRHREPNVAAEAKSYLQERQVEPLKQDLESLLRSADSSILPSLPHPLLGAVAPDFELADATGHVQSLNEHLAQGPVVLVFYYGYYCNHCVAQLFALEEDVQKFRELSATIVAISPDSPEETSEKFGKYGRFTFPVLSDPENKTAAAYSIFQAKTAAKPQLQLHGTFLIDQQGVVRWCHYADSPFTDNAALLVEVAKTLGRLTAAESAPAAPGTRHGAVER